MDTISAAVIESICSGVSVDVSEYKKIIAILAVGPAKGYRGDSGIGASKG